ncbi:unnamed protein product [Linum trigynum]|uniref:Uncharacterized protein n=1 Tax=Linum trigynum TaxID=586398 RepID=A0AAV2F5C9_9ROSI
MQTQATKIQTSIRCTRHRRRPFKRTQKVSVSTNNTASIGPCSILDLLLLTASRLVGESLIEVVGLQPLQELFKPVAGSLEAFARLLRRDLYLKGASEQIVGCARSRTMTPSL